MMQWFGESWDAPVCESISHCPTPLGVNCDSCEEPIKPDDRGFVVWNAYFGRPWHFNCMMWNVLGPRWEDLLAEVSKPT